VRLFVALDVAPEVRREVTRRLEPLRARAPRARWVDPQVLHLTLVFLGEVAEERVTGLQTALASAFAAHPPLDLAMAGGGSFPPGRPARVLWLGVAGGPALAALQRAVAAAVATPAAGDDKPYHPHVTLARCDPPWRAADVERFATAFAGPIGEPFRVDRGVLVHSRLGPGGAKHAPLAALPLAGSA
jgi:2'-5' RNA ligase